MENQLGALGLGLNAITCWNSLYINAAVDRLEAGGLDVGTAIRARLSPLSFEHINFHGSYPFQRPQLNGRLRDLRDPQRCRGRAGGADVGWNHTTDTTDGGRPSYTVPTRSDGWPDLLGRRPLSSAQRARLREALLPTRPAAPAAPDPGILYLTISGLDHVTDAAKATRLRGRIHAAARTAAERRPTTDGSTDTTITIGIGGTDAADRITALRAALDKLAAKHGWTLSDAPPP
jgi:hypothetical protein